MKKFKKGLLVAALVCLGGFSVLAASACDGGNVVKYEFNTNGGANISSVEVEAGSKYTLPIPTREGYSFEGWYTDAEFSGDPVTEITADKNQTYYAKWQKVYALRLELSGGTLSQTTFAVKEGANVYDFLQDYVPTKAGYEFGAWLKGNVELAKNARMESDLTLTAKYKVGYTVEVYQEKLNGEGYEKAAENIVGYEYSGKEFTPKVKITGFKEVSHADAVTKKTLSDTPSENVFKCYFNRETYSVTFEPNYPNNQSGENKTESVKYGVLVEVPSDYEYEGYCLIGWATSTTGEVIYEANYINNALYNKDGSETTEAATFTPERNMTLFGVWKKGYTDMFGGSDSIFVLDENSSVAYLSRGGFFFKGTYNGAKKEFRFTDSKLSKSIFGRLNDDGTYIYSSTARAESVHTLYEVGGALVNTTQIFFDYYNGITYIDEQGTSKGTYVIDGAYYVATFTEGVLAGKTLTLIVNTVELDDKPTPIFQIRNEEEIELGTIVHYTVNGANLEEDNYNKLKLNGFGSATCSMQSGTTTFAYTYDKENKTITLRNSSNTELVCCLITVNGKTGYMEYTEAFDKNFEINGEESLTLDGVYKATYKNGASTVEGKYTTKDSVFGGTIVMITTDANEEYVFIITENTETLPDQTKTTYTVTKKNGGYAEYYYMQSTEEIYYAPLLVMNEPKVGQATLYGYTNTQTHEKVSVGTYTFNKETGLYLYETKEYFEAPNASGGPYDLSDVKSFVYALDDELMALSVNYWYSWTAKDDTTTNLSKTYTSDLGGKLTLVGGFAFYEDKGIVVSGVYTTDESGVTTIITTRGSVWIEIYENTKKFLTLDGRPYNAYLIKEDGTVNRSYYIAFNAKGGATYTELTFDNKGEVASRITYVGTVEKLTETIDAGANVYEFRSSELTFKYLPLGDGANSYYSPYNEKYNGQYDGKSGGRLILDGYGYMASYTDSAANTQEGRYRVYKENVIEVQFNSGIRYFDLKDGKFTVRGEEYGSYVLLQNQLSNGIYLEFDGYGKLTVYTYEDVEDEDTRVEIDANGSYEVSDDGFLLVYNNGNEKITLDGVCNFAEGTFIVRNKKAEQTFVNASDWSILVLDELGNATKYTAEGEKDVGSYVLITDTLLYFVNDDGDDACIYVYDREKSTATPIKFTARSYYTTDLEALLFSEYGFAIFNGGTRYYYNVVNDKVVMYRQAELGEKANEYGFVIDETFGSFDDEKVYEGKTYYANSGYAIEFVRKENGKDKYPVLVSENNKLPLEALTFTPSGEPEFSVIGKVKISGQKYDCQVTREIDENGNVEMYVALGAGIGHYRFDISVVYTGSNSDEESNNNNKYEITGMSWIVSSYSYAYLDTYYNYFLNDYYYGTSLTSSYENDKGFMTIHRVYDEAGEEVKNKHYVTGTFFEGSGMYCLDGSIAEFEKAALDESMVETANTYVATFTGNDGYVYRIYFSLQYHRAFGMYGYVLKAFTREETLQANDGYTVIVERCIASDNAFNPNVNYKETIKKGDEVIVLGDFDGWALLGENNDKLYYIDSEYDADNNLVSSTYYNISYTTNSSGSIDQESKVPATYATATVFIEDAKVYYDENDKTTYAEILPSLGVVTFNYKGSFALATTSTYNEQKGAYIVIVIGEAYEIKIVGEYITMKALDRYYSEDGRSSAVISEEYGLVVLTYNWYAKLVQSYTYDETTGVYTVTDKAGVKYTVKIVGEYVEIELVDEE